MASTLPKISIVTPSYNQAAFLEKTILSVLTQNYLNLEYIIIDGGSTDGSLKIIKKYQKHLTYWQSKKDHGQADAVQQGFNRSTGKIMCWLNSDDILLPGTLKVVAGIFQQFPQIAWFTSRHLSINTNDNIVIVGNRAGRLSSLIRLGLYHGKALGFIPQEGTFWRRQLYQASGNYIDNKYYCLDFKLWQRFANHACLVTLNIPLSAFRITPTQKTNPAEKNKYYQEISPVLGLLPRQFGIISRLANPILHRLSPRITYFHDSFVFKPGPFFRPGIY
jgi:glycosyltransferase involved in cell wall biosynthesis